MENYKLQFRINKKDFPKLKDEELQINTVKNFILNGIAKISILERTEDFFNYPEGSYNWPGWNNKINIDLLIEFSLLLSESDALDENVIRQKAVNYTADSNMFSYIYEDELGRHISFGRIDVPGKDYYVPGYEKDADDTKAPKEKKENVQVDMFKKKGKSK